MKNTYTLRFQGGGEDCGWMFTGIYKGRKKYIVSGEEWRYNENDFQQECFTFRETCTMDERFSLFDFVSKEEAIAMLTKLASREVKEIEFVA